MNWDGDRKELWGAARLSRSGSRFMGVMPLAGERYIIKKKIIVPDVLVCV